MIDKKRQNTQQNEVRDVQVQQGADIHLELDGIEAPQPNGYSFGATQIGSAAKQPGKAGQKTTGGSR